MRAVGDGLRPGFGDEEHLAAADHGGERHLVRPSGGGVIDGGGGGVPVHVGEVARPEDDAVHVGRDGFGGSAAHGGPLRAFPFALLLAHLGEGALDGGDQFRRGRFEERRRLAEAGVLGAGHLVGGFAGDRLDASDAARRAALGHDAEGADLGGGADVDAAAKLAGELADLDHPHLVAVLLAEKGRRASCLGFGDGQVLVGRDVLISEDALDDAPLDPFDLVGGEGLSMERSRSGGGRGLRGSLPGRRARPEPRARRLGGGGWRCGCAGSCAFGRHRRWR